MKKIFLIIPSLKQGGAERVISTLANEWASNGDQVFVVLLANTTIFYNLLPEVTIINLGFENKSFFKNLISQICILFRLRKIANNAKPDFLLSFMVKYNLFTILTMCGLKLRIYISDRSNPKKKEPFIYELGRKFLYRYADGIVAQTQLAKEILFKTTKNRNIKVIPNPVRNVVNNLQTNRENIIINVGRMVPEKNQKFLLKAFASIRNDNWKLIFLGDGPLRTELEIEANSLGISNNVIFQGTVSDVDTWLYRSSVFAFSSLSEGFPNALIEAMASGLPAISFDCDAGPRDLIENNVNGILIPLDDEELYIYRLKELMENDLLRNMLGGNAKNIRKNLSVNSIANQYRLFCSSLENLQ